jgi:hypothetical protein
MENRSKLDSTCMSGEEDILDDLNAIISESQEQSDHLLALLVHEELVNTKQMVVHSIDNDLKSHERLLSVYNNKLADLRSFEEGFIHQVLAAVDTQTLESQIEEYARLQATIEQIINKNFCIDCNQLISQDEFRKLLNLKGVIDDIKSRVTAVGGQVDAAENDMLTQKLDSCKRKISRVKNDLQHCADRVNEMEKNVLKTGSELLNKLE